MGEAVKLRGTPEYAASQAPREAKRKATKAALDSAKGSFEGKVFGDLNGQEKDDLLKALAIRAGLIEE